MELDHAYDGPDRVHPRICFWIFGARVDIATAPCQGQKNTMKSIWKGDAIESIASKDRGLVPRRAEEAEDAWWIS